MSSHTLHAFCLDASYISAFDILNIPSVATSDSSLRQSSNLSWLADTNITIYVADPASVLLDKFAYVEITSLPLSKPLAIQCPVPACIFPISGYFTFLQRLLVYLNIVIATFALPVPLLRGVSQIWLTTFWCSVLMMFLATAATTKTPQIYNLDFQPAVLIVHIGLLPTLLWFSFRAEPGEPVHNAKRARDTDTPDEPQNTLGPEVAMHSEEIITERPLYQRWKKSLTDFPVTRILVPFYALFEAVDLVAANVTQDQAGFWPKETAVIVTNGTNYLLTSPCFEDHLGAVGLWAPLSPYNGIRALNSLSIYYPPAGSTAAEALQTLPRAAILPLHVGSVLLPLGIFLLSLFKIGKIEGGLRRMFRNPQYHNQTIHYLAILPFTAPLIAAVIITLFVIIKFESNAWGAALPESERYTEIGQWGPYVVSILVFTATLMARIRGWDFDTKDTDGQKRAFEWLRIRNESEWDEREGRARLVESVDAKHSIPLQVIDGAGGPFGVDWHEEDTPGLRRGIQAP